MSDPCLSMTRYQTFSSSNSFRCCEKAVCAKPAVEESGGIVGIPPIFALVLLKGIGGGAVTAA